jgi:hypothetical protein
MDGLPILFISFLKMLVSLVYIGCFYLFVFGLCDIDLRWQVSFYSIVIVLSFILLPLLIIEKEHFFCDLKSLWQRVLFYQSFSLIGVFLFWANAKAINLILVGIVCLLYAKIWTIGFFFILYALSANMSPREEDDFD